jgi:transposase
VLTLLVVGRGEVTDKALGTDRAAAVGRRMGGQGRDHRQVINAIPFKLRHGAPWRDLPPGRYGPWKPAHERTLDGTWETILAEAVLKDDAIGEVRWSLSVDWTVVRAHQHAGGPGKGRCRPRSRASQWGQKGLGAPGADRAAISICPRVGGHADEHRPDPGQDDDNRSCCPCWMESVSGGPGRTRHTVPARSGPGRQSLFPPLDQGRPA